jgi:hypothetical protein
MRVAGASAHCESEAGAGGIHDAAGCCRVFDAGWNLLRFGFFDGCYFVAFLFALSIRIFFAFLAIRIRVAIAFSVASECFLCLFGCEKAKCFTVMSSRRHEMQHQLYSTPKADGESPVNT